MVFQVTRADGGSTDGPVAVSIDYRGFRDAYGANYSDRLELVRYPACVVTVPEDPSCSVGTPVADQFNDPYATTMTAVVDASGTTAAPSSANPAPSDSATPTAGAASTGLQPAMEPRAAMVDTVSPSPTDSPSSSSPTDSPSPSPSDSTSAAVGAPSTGSVFVVQSASSGPSGSYDASPLAPSASWSVGLESGTLNYSYPLSVPAPMGGASPRVALDYDSGSIDGRTSSTNPQASMFGMGWDYQPGFIEREYDACNNSGEGGSYPDECYVSSHQDVTLSLNGRSMHLIRDGATGTWRMQDDPGWSVNNGTGADNGDKNGEYWVLKSPDGTLYYFGRNYGRKPALSTPPKTNSTWTLPVWKWDTSCPVTGVTACTKAWRWNLDYVIDSNNNATAYYYTQETNAYKAHNGATATQYVRGGRVSSITYGFRDADPLTVNPVDQVLFGVVGRCVQNQDGANAGCPTLGPANATSYPDTPVDQVCVPNSTTCTVTKPTFFSTSMVASATTQVLTTGSTYTSLDRYDLRLNFPDPDGSGPESPTLWLSQVTRTGLLGGSLALQPMILYGAALPNRVADGTSGFTPVDQWRVSAIFNETGGEIAVNYGHPDGCNTALVDHSTNTADCFPVNWQPTGSTTWNSGWFYKYLITRLGQYVEYAGEVPTTTAPTPALISEPIVTDYTYSGGAGWHKNEFQLNAGDTDVWNEYRGYRTVRVVEDEVDNGVISPSASRSVTVHTFYRGMNGGKYQDGSTNTDTVVTNDLGTTPDYAWLQGREAEAVVQTQGGSLVQRTDTNYWTSQTASMASAVTTDPAEVAVEVQPYTTIVDTPTTNGGYRQHEAVDVHYNAGTATDIANGAIVTHVDAGDIASVDPAANCTSINYTKNTNPYIIVPQLKATYSGLASGAACPGTGLMAESKYYYDGAHALNNGGTSPQNVPAQGNLTCTHEYLTAAASGDCPATQVASTDVADTYVDYDVYGRVIDTTDPDLHKSLTAYTPSSGRPDSVLHTSPTISQPSSHTLTSNTTLDYRGLPTLTADNNNPANTTKMVYDALGRLIKAYAPTEYAQLPNTDVPTFIASYDDERSGWSTIETKNLIDIDSGSVARYRDTWTYLDGWERPREVHTLPYGGSGHLTVRTRYDDRGEVAASSSPYPVDNVAINAGMDKKAANWVPLETRYTYDYLHRLVTSTRTASGVQSWGTTTTSYAGDQVVTTPPAPAPKVTATIDAWGRPLVSQEVDQTDDTNSSKTTYAYDSLGRMISVADDANVTNTYGYDLGGRRTTSTDADAGTTTVRYDAMGNPIATSDTVAGEVDRQYDAVNRLVRVSWNDGSLNGVGLVDYAYDLAAASQGRLGSVTVHDIANSTGDWKTSYDSYDADGRSTQVTYSVPSVSGLPSGGASFQFTTAYQAGGQPKSLGYPTVGDLASETVTTAYETANGGTGLPVTLSGSNGLSVTNTYTSLNQLMTRTLGQSGNGQAVRTYTYDDPLRRLSEIQTNATSGGVANVVQDDAYSYDNANNPTQINDKISTAPDNNQRTCFGYDGLDRLTLAYTESGACGTTTAQDGPAGYNEAFTYYPNGTPHTLSESGTSTTYTEGGTSEPPHAVTAFGNNTFSYDAVGQQTSRNVAGVLTNESWDHLHHLYRTTTGQPAVATQYVSGPDGTRIARQDADGSTTIWLGTDELRVASGAITDTRYYTLAGTTVAMRTASSLTWLASDTQNSRQLAINASTGAVTRAYYTPYGKVRPNGSPLPTDQNFLGHVLDSTGLVQGGARYYDPSIGQFSSPDPLANSSDSQSLDPYNYAADNPSAWSDPSGLMNQPVGGSAPDLAGVPYAVPPTQWAPKPKKKPHHSWWDKTGETGALVAGVADGVSSAVDPKNQYGMQIPPPNCGSDWQMCQIAYDDGRLVPGLAAAVLDPAALADDIPEASLVFAREAAAAEDGVSLTLKYNPGWDAAQRAAADTKVGALNDAARSGGLRVTQVERSGTSAASRYSRAGRDIPSGSDIDHTIDLQLGGLDVLGNMGPLDASVNRSLGAQIGWQLRGVPQGTCVFAVAIC